MKYNIKLDIHHLTRIEGHGNIHIVVENGKLVDSKWAVVETPRFFESMLRGLSLEMAPLLVARICGICSISHTLASIRAIERALGIQVPEAAGKARLLAKHGETLQSHLLHLSFLVSPDFFNEKSIIPLFQTNRVLIESALRLKRLANNICDIVAGRTTHPVSLCIGGIHKLPDKKELQKLKKDIDDIVPDLRQIIEFFKTIKLPDFKRETEFVSLKGVKAYPWIGGDLVSTDGVLKGENDFLAMTNEYKEDFTTSKFARLSRKSFAVGALARINNNYNLLKAKDIAEGFALRPVNHNPFMNNRAQLVECMHIMHESGEILDELLDNSLNDICVEYNIEQGEGTGAVEAPRGILYHHYQIDKKGLIEKANCIIPTTQNNANIHYDIAALVEKALVEGESDSGIKRLCEMLVRSYDPCLSCSVH